MKSIRNLLVSHIQQVFGTKCIGTDQEVVVQQQQQKQTNHIDNDNVTDTNNRNNNDNGSDSSHTKCYDSQDTACVDVTNQHQSHDSCEISGIGGDSFIEGSVIRDAGCATVVEYQHVDTLHWYVAKKMRITKDADEEKITKVRRGYQNEISMLKRISHENIVEMLGYHIGPGIDITIIMPEYNGDLWTEIQKLFHQRKTFSEKEIIEISIQIMKAVNYLFSQKVVHRDLKSTNVLVTLSTSGAIETCHLCDFYTSKQFEDYENAIGSGEIGIIDRATKLDIFDKSDNCLTGTRGYMAPEVQTHHYNPFYADSYSFGIVLFELITTTPLRHVTDRYTKTPTITMTTNASPIQTKLIELYQSLTCPQAESRPLPPAILEQFYSMSEETTTV